MRNDQMMLRLDGSLHVIADHAGLSARRCHGAGIGIGQRDLRLSAFVHPPLDGLQGIGFSPAVSQLLDRARKATVGNRHPGLAHHLVGTVELDKIRFDNRVYLAKATLEFLTREALGLRIDGFELAAIDCDNAGVKEIETAAKGDELLAYLADRWTVVAAEVG